MPRSAAETMSLSGKYGDVNADITKLRKDVLKQAIASLASFIGSVNCTWALSSLMILLTSLILVSPSVRQSSSLDTLHLSFRYRFLLFRH